MSAREPLWDVFLTLHLASRHEADKLGRILTRDDEPPILAVMAETVPNDTRWFVKVSIGVYAPASLTAIIRAGKYVRRACRRLGFEAHMTGEGVTVAPSRLFEPPGATACGQCGRTGTASRDFVADSTLYSWPFDGAERYICRGPCRAQED